MRILLISVISQWPISTYAQFEDRGVSWSVDYTGDYVSNFKGGNGQGGVFLGNLDLLLQLNGDRLWGLDGSSVFLYGLNNHGGAPSDLVGDAQGLDNIEAPAAWRLYEAWIEQTFWTSKISALVGFYDLNSEFDATETGGLFINSSHGIGPDISQSGKNGPSIFPVTSLGIRLKWAPRENMYLQGVALDGVSGDPESPRNNIPKWSQDDGVLLVAETGFLIASEGVGVRRFDEGAYSLKISAGYWLNTSEIDAIDIETNASNQGFYALVDKNIFREKDSPAEGLNAFFRFGMAESTLNRFGSYVGGGISYSGLFAGRDEDQIGLSVAHAMNGDAYRTASDRIGVPTERSETVFEFAYGAVITDKASVQLDLQYVVNPDTNPDLNNAFAGIMRWVFSL